MVSRHKLKEIGLKVKQTKGDSLDVELNASGKHWVVQIETVTDAILLAKALTSRGPLFYRKDEVMRAFASSLASGRIPPDRVHPDLLKKLFEGGLLRFVAAERESGDGDAAPSPAAQ